VATDIMLLDACELIYFENTDYDGFKKRHAGFVAQRRKKAEAEAKEASKLQRALSKVWRGKGRPGRYKGEEAAKQASKLYSQRGGHGEASAP
jgi:ATP-binding cassette subfamily F protein 1